jgi:cyclopropane-fatty-acyl-phospholipid synthase
MSNDRTELIGSRVRPLVRARAIPSLTERVAARALAPILGNLDRGRLRLELPSGSRIEQSGRCPGRDATLCLRRWRALRRLAVGGDVGFAEGYIHGEWTTPDLVALLEWAMQNEPALEQAVTGFSIARLADRVRHFARSNTRRGSRRNIAAHYDLGNDFYAAWLDADMNYSAALYATPALSLEEAQDAKLDRIIALLDVKPGDHVLEIGCGWGALAERLVKRHQCRLTGITLSREQRTYTQSRLSDEGLILLQDYRDITGVFDAVVSIEMLEAAGEPYWPVFFDRLRASLKPGGIAILQVITIDETRFAAYRRRPDFIQRHIFPGGMLPTVSIIREQLAAAGLSLQSLEHFGQSYALTLGEWRKRFLHAKPPRGAGRSGEAFRRRWDYYLAYCEVGFRSGALDVGLYRITRNGSTR